jgi:hypothetical protein
MKKLNLLRPSPALALFYLLMAIASFSVDAQTSDNNAQGAEPASASLSDLANLRFEKASFTLGLAYTQVTYKSNHANAIGNAQITDNGAPSPIIELNSSEKILKAWPLPAGSASIGWDINATASTFDTHYQLVNSALRGEDIGTRVSGEYIGVAPTFFLKMGPLYSDSSIFWKVGYGIGPAIFHGSGTAYFNTTSGGIVTDVGSSSPVLALYQAASWKFQMGHWYLNFMAKLITPQGDVHTSLESYGFGFAYRIGL